MPEHPSTPAHRKMTRAVVIVGVVVRALALALPELSYRLVVSGPTGAGAAASRRLVDTLQALGPTFVKFGQISSTRRDTMPAVLCDEMDRLHDAVAAMPIDDAIQAIRGADVPGLTSWDHEPVASGSIAGVYRGVLADGRVVALKVKRPGVDERMHADLALMEQVVRVLERLPKTRGMPLADLVGYMSRAILGQLDFAREAENVERLATSVRRLPEVRVPKVYGELSGADCLVFEFIPDLDTAAAATLTPDTRAHLARRALDAASRMMFVHGFVHCDLHPGNLYLTPDARIVILDAGYCVELPDRVRRLIGEFFTAMALGRGRRCGEILLDSALDDSGVEREAFLTDAERIVADHAGPGAEFDMAAFGDAVFGLQQQYGIYAASDFAFPMMSLAVLDGTVRRMCEDVDFQAIGAGGSEPRPTSASSSGS